MEGSAAVHDGPRADVDEGSEESRLPESIRQAADAQVSSQSEMDATEWLLESDGPTADETEPQPIRLTVGGREIVWQVVPLPDAEFRRYRKMVTGNRRARRALMQGDVSEVNDWKYHCLIVAAATVSPNLDEAAAKKGVDKLALIEHRFAAKPGLVNQISGVVSDISGYDEGDVEVVRKAVGNS